MNDTISLPELDAFFALPTSPAPESAAAKAARTQGEQAQQAGTPSTRNPYSHGTAEHTAWDKGWWDGDS